MERPSNMSVLKIQNTVAYIANQLFVNDDYGISNTFNTMDKLSHQLYQKCLNIHNHHLLFLKISNRVNYILTQLSNNDYYGKANAFNDLDRLNNYLSKYTHIHKDLLRHRMNN